MNVCAGTWNNAAFHQYVRKACDNFAHRPEFKDITRPLYDGIPREDDFDGNDIGTAAHLDGRTQAACHVSHWYVGRVIEFGIIVGTTLSGEPGGCVVPSPQICIGLSLRGWLAWMMVRAARDAPALVCAC